MSDTAQDHGKLTRAAYEELPGINWSVLKLCIDHPSKALEALKNPRVPTARMVLGTAIHCDVLEGPETFRKSFAVMPEGIDRRTKVGKEEYAKFETGSKGRAVISKDDYRTVKRVRDSLMAHPAVSDLLSTGSPERSITWELAESLFGKGMIDWLPSGDGPIIDIKTTRDASPKGFARQIANLRYHGQACFYRRGVASLEGAVPRDFVIIAVEVEPPYCVGVYRLNHEAIEAGDRMVDMSLDRWLAASRGQQGYDPHFTDYIEDLGIPTWALSDETANVVA